MIKKIAFLGLICLFGSCIAPFKFIDKLTLSYAEAPKIIKFATVAPEGSTWTNVLHDIDNELQEKSEGRLRLRIYPGGVTGDEKDVIRKMRIGQLHCAGFTGVGLGEILPEVRIFDLPFFYKDYDEIDFIRNSFRDRFTRAFEERGYVLLGWTEVGFVYFFSKKEVKSLNELKTTKMWLWEDDPLAKTLFEAINISPIPLSISDVMTSLQTGLIDSVYASPMGIIALQWFTKVKYMLNLPMANATSAILMTKKIYDSIPADLQDILKNTFETHLERLTRLTREDNAKSLEVLKDSGIVFSLIKDEAVVNEFKNAGKKACELLVGNLYSTDLLKEARTMIEGYREGNKDKE